MLQRSRQNFNVQLDGYRVREVGLDLRRMTPKVLAHASNPTSGADTAPPKLLPRQCPQVTLGNCTQQPPKTLQITSCPPKAHPDGPDSGPQRKRSKVHALGTLPALRFRVDISVCQGLLVSSSVRYAALY